MTSQRVLKKAGAGGFRAKLLVAMMLAVFASTAAVLWVAQRRTEAEVQQNLQQEFQSRLGFLLGAQEARRAAIAERCRIMAKSVRIRASLEENDVEDLYLNAKVELRDLLDQSDGSTPEAEHETQRAKFFRFLNASGDVMSPPDADVSPKSGMQESQLAMSGGARAEQQVGYLVVKNESRDSLHEIIATPIIATDTGEAIGEIVLGFKPAEVASGRADGSLKSGIWVNGELHMPALAKGAATMLDEQIAKTIGASSASDSSFVANVNGEPHLLFYKILNPGSQFSPAYQVCLFPLADSLTRQRQLRWKIIGLGALVLLLGLVASHFVSGRLSAPVEKLAEDSAENLVKRERAEAALDLTNDELRALNAELQKALADLKATQEQVIQQERLRALGQMASGIAHDFNNALMPILGFCELLLLSPAILDDRQTVTDYLGMIQTAAKDAGNIVGRLREFYRTHTDDEIFVPVNLKKLVEQTVTLTRPKWKDQAQANGATVRIALELEPVMIAGEESALREALTNLIFNAVDAMPSGGTITFRTRRDGESALLEIADTGTGMSEEVRHRCLEPFFSTKGERGTGLGLSMVFGIMQRHGGSLDLRSEPGKGTTFVITLPLHEAASERAGIAASATHLPQRSLRVLVVDDEPQVRDLLTASLATDGHQIEIANHGVDGFKCFLDGGFDLVVTDKAMPGMSGDQMATAIKQIAPKMPIILLTGFGQFHTKEDFPDIDVLASKPISIPALRSAVATAMESA